MLFILRWLARLPLAWLHGAGALLGRAVYRLSAVYAARMRDNLHASGIAAGESDFARILANAIRESGKATTEVLKAWFGPTPEVERLVLCKDWAVVDRARTAGRGILFLTPHLGCFEMSALYGAQRLPITVLYRPPRVRWLEPIMVAGRTRFGARLAPATLKGVRNLYRALQKGEAIGILPDQAPGTGEGAWADFFGRPAYTMTLVGRLQAATQAAVILAFAERLPGGAGYQLHLEHIEEQLDPPALNKVLENLIRRCPEQYLWSYNRYKIPAGAPPPVATNPMAPTA